MTAELCYPVSFTNMSSPRGLPATEQVLNELFVDGKVLRAGLCHGGNRQPLKVLLHGSEKGSACFRLLDLNCMASTFFQTNQASVHLLTFHVEPPLSFTLLA